MVATLLLAAALSRPAPLTGHQLTTAVGYGPQGPILVVSWTGRRRWGAWFRVDQQDVPRVMANSTHVSTTAGSVGVGWRPRPRLTVGLGYGRKEETNTLYGEDVGNGEVIPVVLDVRKDRQDGLAAIGTWTFPVNDTLGVAASASAGPGGFGAAVGVTFFFP